MMALLDKLKSIFSNDPKYLLSNYVYKVFEY